MASVSWVLPFWTEMPMFTFSARSSSLANWKSPSVPEKFRITRLSSLAAAPMAVGMSVQMKSTVPVWSCMIMAGALSAGASSSAFSIWGRQESYQMVPDWAVHLPPARSAMEVASANWLPLVVTQTMVA